MSVLEDLLLSSEECLFDQTVSEALNGKIVYPLMVTGQNQWDIDLVKDIFEDTDIKLILVIPLQNTVANSWYWCNEKMGQYALKSA